MVVNHSTLISRVSYSTKYYKELSNHSVKLQEDIEVQNNSSIESITELNSYYKNIAGPIRPITPQQLESMKRSDENNIPIEGKPTMPVGMLQLNGGYQGTSTPFIPTHLTANISISLRRMN